MDPATGSAVNIVFLDISLPGISGIDIVRQLPRTRQFAVVATTGSVDDQSLDDLRYAVPLSSRQCTHLMFTMICGLCRKCGFTGCLAKPFSRRDLQLVVHRVGQLRNYSWFVLISGALRG